MKRMIKYLFINIIYNIIIFVEAFRIIKEFDSVILQGIFVAFVMYKGIYEMIFVYRGIFRSVQYNNNYQHMILEQVREFCSDKWTYKEQLFTNIKEGFYNKQEISEIIDSLKRSFEYSLSDRIEGAIFLIINILLILIIGFNKTIVFIGIMSLKVICDNKKLNKEKINM